MFLTDLITETLCVRAGLILMALAMLAYVGHMLLPKSWIRHIGTGFTVTSVLSLVTSIVIRSVEAEFFALSNMYEALVIMDIGLLLAYIVVERWFKVYHLGWAVITLALVILFYAGTLPTEITPLQAALRSYWRSIHVPPLLLSYGFFTVALFSAIGFLLSDKQSHHGSGGGMNATSSGGALFNREGEGLLAYQLSPPAQLYDEVTYRCITAGFVLMTIGVILGAVWANEAWGNYWSWDPKESMSLVTLLGYGSYLHMRINGEHSPRTMAWVAIAGFLLVVMTFVGVNVWGFGSLHSYGAIEVSS